MMEELADRMDNVQVERGLSSTRNANARQGQYKQKRSQDQRERRDKLLALQKRSRKEVLNQLRNIDQDEDWEKFESELLYDGDDDDDDSSMDTSSGEPAQRKKRNYKNQLMLSEWMIEVPSDFAQKWLMVQCPVGKRCLVITSKRRTYSYSKVGHRLRSFPSELPGGGPNSSANGATWLDCIFCEAKQTFYVLDALTWNNHALIESDTEFRAFWVKSKLSEQPELSRQTQCNRYAFVPLMYQPCHRDVIHTAMHTILSYELDGLLFYHKETQYLRGTTPLVVWLKPYMVLEVLGITVPPLYTDQQPRSYTGFDNHVGLIKSRAGLPQKHQELYVPRKGEQLCKAEKILISDAKFCSSIQRQLPTSEPTLSGPAHSSFGRLPYQVNVQTASLSGEISATDSTNSAIANSDAPQDVTNGARPKQTVSDQWKSYR